MTTKIEGSDSATVTWKTATYSISKACLKTSTIFDRITSHAVFVLFITPGRRQSKTLLIDEYGLKIARNSVSDCHLSPDWLSNDFLSTFFHSINIFHCPLSGVLILYGFIMWMKNSVNTDQLASEEAS